MATRELGIILHGATGGICSFQHLHNSLAPIIAEGGVTLDNKGGGDRVMPKLLLVGRNAEKLAKVSAANGGPAWSTDLDAALANPDYPVFFDAAAFKSNSSPTRRESSASSARVTTERRIDSPRTRGADVDATSGPRISAVVVDDDAKR